MDWTAVAFAAVVGVLFSTMVALGIWGIGMAIVMRAERTIFDKIARDRAKNNKTNRLY